MTNVPTDFSEMVYALGTALARYNTRTPHPVITITVDTYDDKWRLVDGLKQQMDFPMGDDSFSIRGVTVAFRAKDEWENYTDNG
jgi:hypothetical protein